MFDIRIVPNYISIAYFIFHFDYNFQIINDSTKTDNLNSASLYIKLALP